MNLSLLVVRCQDIEKSKSFYEKLGLTFQKEKHEEGPTHYSCEENGIVFELYPNKGNAPGDNNRLGFKVRDLKHVLSQVECESSYEFMGNKVYIAQDPDGRKVEISE